MRAIGMSEVEKIAGMLGITNVAALKDAIAGAGAAGVMEAVKGAAYEEMARTLSAAHKPIGFVAEVA